MKRLFNSAPWAILLSLVCVAARAEEQVIRLYDGPAPGSEDWKQTEGRQRVEFLGGDIVTNVVDPTLTMFRPAEGKSIGTGMIVCPGGGFHLLTVDHEGANVARWLAERGVTAFVLKYRLKETKTDNLMAETMANFEKFDEVMTPAVKLATADALASIRYVRTHAAEYGIDPARIGIIGFSAGGMVAVETACRHGKEDRPDFAAAIYLGWPEGSGEVPTDAPPLFIAAATDDQLSERMSPAAESVRLYQQWFAAKKPVELHMYAAGGHGFGLRKQGTPSDAWPDEFATWLKYRGLLGK